MWENIVVILLILGLSYLFRQNNTNIGSGNNKVKTFDAQMLFILFLASKRCMNRNNTFIYKKAISI